MVEELHSKEASLVAEREAYVAKVNAEIDAESKTSTGSFVSAFKSTLDKYPLLVNCMLGATLSVLGKVVCETLVKGNASVSSTVLGKSAGLGMMMALVMVPYYAMLFTFEFASYNAFLDKALKVIFNQIFLTSLMTAISIAYSFLLSADFDGTGASVWNEVVAKFVPLLKVDVAYWSISDFLCFLTVPQDMMVFASSVSRLIITVAIAYRA